MSEQCKNMEDVHKLLKALFKDTLEQMLEAEMDEHLGYEKHNLISVTFSTPDKGIPALVFGKPFSESTDFLKELRNNK